MKRYEKYIHNDSVIIASLPKGWRYLPLKYIAKFFTGNSLNDKEKDLFSETVGEALPYIATKDISPVNQSADYDNGISIPKSEISYKVAPKDSFLICIEGGSAGRKMTYLTQDVYFVNKLCCIDAKESKKYLYYAFQSTPFQSDFKQSLQGLIGGVSISKLSDMRFAIPSYDEQEKIAAFLDYKTEKIDRLTVMLNARIENLKKYRQSMITLAVTNGLNNSAEMKDSGVVEIGNIPAHWSLSPMKYLLEGSMKYGANESAESDNRDWPRYIRITDIAENGTLRDDSFKSLSPDKANGYMLHKGDVLFARSGATVGKTYLFNEDYPACYAGYLIKATCGVKLLPEYLIRYTQSSSYDSWKNSVYILSTIQNIGADKYSNLPIPVPPIEEQMSIVEYLDRKTKQIDDTIAATEQQIKDLQAYRISLISEAVTGQIDVRDWTAPIE